MTNKRLPEQLERASMAYGMAYIAHRNLEALLPQGPVQYFVQGDEQGKLIEAAKILRNVIDRAYVDMNQIRLEMK